MCIICTGYSIKSQIYCAILSAIGGKSMNLALLKQVKLPLNVHASGVASLVNNNNNHNYNKN